MTKEKNIDKILNELDKKLKKYSPMLTCTYHYTDASQKVLESRDIHLVFTVYENYKPRKKLKTKRKKK